MSENGETSLDVYGTDAEAIRTLAQDPELAKQLHPELPYIAAEVVWAARDGDGAHRGGRAGAEDAGSLSECAVRL